MPTLIKKAGPPGLPYKNEITDAARVAVVKRAGPNIPANLLGRLTKATTEIRRLVQAQEALSFESVKQAHNAARESAVVEILHGAEPVSQFKHLDTLGREFAARRDALKQAQARIFAGSIGDIEAAGAIILAAVSKLATETEREEGETAEEFGVEFQPSTQLKLIQSVAMLIGRRFEGLRPAAAVAPANMGSAASFLADLLPGVADW